MRKGDLVKFKDGKGFSWWGNHVYIYLEQDEQYLSWCKVLKNTGEIIDVEIKSLELVR
jgi:hypothetical protein